MSNVTRDQIESASTKGLQNLYLQMTGKPTTNRNAKALRVRLIEMVGKAQLVAPMTATTAMQGAIDASAAKPVAKSPRLNKIAERVGKRAVAASARLIKAAKPSKPKAVKKSTRQDRIDAGELSAPVKKPLKTARADKGINRKPLKLKSSRKAHEDSETRRLFSELTQGQVLSHRFRDGNGGWFTLECIVVTVPGLDGKGGKYRYDRKNYDSVRDVIEAMGAPKWNPALFFKLRPYWPHKKRAEKKAAA